jgi:hypothetical protein
VEEIYNVLGVFMLMGLFKRFNITSELKEFINTRLWISSQQRD